MKKLFERMKSYSFWVSFPGALIIFINCLGRIFNFQIENEIVEDVIMSIAGLLVVLGFVTKETKDNEDKPENIEEESSEGVVSEDEQKDKEDEKKNQDKDNLKDDNKLN